MIDIMIYKTGFGWISPMGNIISCKGSYKHLETLCKWSDVEKYYPAIPAILERIENIHKDCKALSDSGEHPEWHNYEMAMDDADYTIRIHLLDLGFIRIGKSRYDKVIEVEGAPEAIKERLAIINKLVDEFNIENRVEYTLRVHTVNKH